MLFACLFAALSGAALGQDADIDLVMPDLDEAPTLPADEPAAAPSLKVDLRRLMVQDQDSGKVGVLKDDLDQRVRAILRAGGVTLVENAVDRYGRHRGEMGDLRLGGDIGESKCKTLVNLPKDRESRECQVLVHWRLATADGQVIYQATVRGTGRLSGAVGESLDGALGESFVDSARQLAQRPTFRQRLQADAYLLRGRLGAAGSAPDIGVGRCPHGGATPPDGLAELQQAVIVVSTADSRAAGVLLTPDGLLLGPALNQEPTVALPAGTELPAAVLRVDPGTGLALMKVETSDQSCLLLAEEPPASGITTWLVGPPGERVAEGIVSGVRVQAGRTIVQTDAGLNASDWGAPLVDASGAVLGVTVGQITAVGVEGLGFAAEPQDLLDHLGAELAEESRIPAYADLSAAALADRTTVFTETADTLVEGELDKEYRRHNAKKNVVTGIVMAAVGTGLLVAPSSLVTTLSDSARGLGAVLLVGGTGLTAWGIYGHRQVSAGPSVHFSWGWTRSW